MKLSSLPPTTLHVDVVCFQPASRYARPGLSRLIYYPIVCE